MHRFLWSDLAFLRFGSCGLGNLCGIGWGRGMDVVHTRIVAWASPARNAPPAVLPPRPRPSSRPGSGVSTGLGSPSRACGLRRDRGHGPAIGGSQTTLWCARPASVAVSGVIPVWDKTLPTVTACLDATLRRIGGVGAAYELTDDEKTVTTDHIAGIAVRNPEIVEVAKHYGMTIRTCVPADPKRAWISEVPSPISSSGASR